MNTPLAVLSNSSQQVGDHGSSDIRQSKITTAVAKGQLLVIDAQLIQDRRLQIVDADRIFNAGVSKVIRFSV